MAVDYDALQDAAEELIDDNGRDITIQKRSDTVPDSSKPWEPAADGSGTNINTIGVFEDYSISEFGGTNIQIGDKKILIKGKGLSQDITTEDQIIDGSETWNIINVKKVQPGDTVIMYEIQARL